MSTVGTSVLESAVPVPGAAAPVHIAIRATPPRVLDELREVWHHRELFYFLAWRDVKVRYKQTVLGIAWAVLQPALSVVVSTLIFGRLAHMPSDGVSYALFFYAGNLPWILMAAGVGASASSLVGSPNLITKVYFPRMIIPGAAVLSGFIDFLIAAVGLVVLGLHGGAHLTWRLLLLPPIVGLILLLTCAVGGWLAAVNVKYRDVRYVVPFFMQMWFLATPVIYPADLVPLRWRPLLALNPMVGYIDAFRAACFGRPLDGVTLSIAVLVTCGLLMLATRTFRSIEQTFADYI
jgi:homopolymeric O-antigen transport system permease protein